MINTLLIICVSCKASFDYLRDNFVSYDNTVQNTYITTLCRIHYGFSIVSQEGRRGESMINTLLIIHVLQGKFCVKKWYVAFLLRREILCQKQACNE